MHLFHKPACPFGWKVLIALHETGLGFTQEVMDPADRQRLARYSPQGTTPVLVDDGFGLWESGAIVEYVNERADGVLMPSNAAGRAQARLLQTYSDSLVGPGLREVIFEKRAKPSAEWDADRIARGTLAWRVCLDWLERQVDSPTGFVEGRFSLADCALIPRFALAERFGVGVSADHPRLFDWFSTQASRISVHGSRPELFGWVNPVGTA